jgi:monoterpene epsilon-lactone hydrolase
MSAFLEDRCFAQQGATVFHAISTADKTAMVDLRAIVEPNKGRLWGTAAPAFRCHHRARRCSQNVIFEAGTVGSIPCWWCMPKGAQPDAAILHIHGGWFN